MLAPAVPGAGKPMLMEVLIMMSAVHNASARFLVVEPTKEMCAAAVARLDRCLVKIGIRQGVTRAVHNERPRATSKLRSQHRHTTSMEPLRA